MNFKFFSLNLLIIILLIFVILNLIILDIKFFQNKQGISNDNINIIKTAVLDRGSKSAVQAQPDTVGVLCPDSCVAKINEATSSVKITNQAVAAPTPQKETITVVVTQPPTGSGAKEFFVPFGGGSNSTDDWADVSGIQSYIDTSLYPQIKSVTFEASVRIPTGNQTAFVRLYNVTDKHPVWSSEVSMEGGTAQLLTSQQITLDTGRKLYQVQMKTSLKYQAFLDQARVHILTY